ncbi:MAG: hypothetical protein KF789_07495 [Bdellovibrionaceae bacterium]|nr:hypothetical protein [Pseudobdellovibrionaceae bacterium]
MNSNIEEKSTKDLIERIKEALRNWYGTLSVKEIISNPILVAEIAALEKMLSRQEVLS